GNQPNITAFTGVGGVDINNIELQNCHTVEDFYALLVTEMLQRISDQRNMYAVQKRSTGASVRIDRWVPANKKEIKSLFGLIIWMGLIKYPCITLFNWSMDPIYYHPFPHKVMSRNRFQIFLRMLHFANNETADVTNRLWKIQPIIDELNENFKQYYHPTELICIDESMIPFRGRIIFRQYMKQKRHRCGIKIFKLSCGLGYTYSFRVYSGKTFDAMNTTPTNTVMNLCEDIFHKGHTLCTDNCAITLSKDGITILKWREKRDVLLLSTKHSIEMETVRTNIKIVNKPKIVIDYNAGKKSIDLSDQMAAYNNPLQKSMKWYRKLSFEN
ncbi:unnamed protein product, partial [Heterotrigona itama]